MFPIPWNFPFKKKDGTLTTLDDAISSGGGSYELPTASATTKGGVKVGASLSIANDVLDLKLSEHTCNLNTDNVTDASHLNVYRLKDNIYMIAGKVVLKNDLAAGTRINIGTLPTGIAPTSGESYIPNFVQATDYGVSAFVPATIPVYANGNIFVNNNVASISLRTVWVNFVIQMGDVPD